MVSLMLSSLKIVFIKILVNGSIYNLVCSGFKASSRSDHGLQIDSYFRN